MGDSNNNPNAPNLFPVQDETKREKAYEDDSDDNGNASPAMTADIHHQQQPNFGNPRPRSVFVTPSPPGGSHIPLPPPSAGSVSSSDWEVVANPNANPMNSTIFNTTGPGFGNVNNPNPNSHLNLNNNFNNSFNNNNFGNSGSGNNNSAGSGGGGSVFNNDANPINRGIADHFNPSNIPLPPSPGPGHLSSSSSNQDGARRTLYAAPGGPTSRQRRAAARADRLRVIEGRIRSVFERRYPGFEYRFERVLRAGAAGQTWLLRYQTGNFGGWERLVLKTPNQGVPQVSRGGSVVNVGFGVLQSRGADMHGDGSPGGGGDEGEEGGWDDDDFGDEDDEDLDEDEDGGGGRVSKRRKNEKRFEKETRAYQAICHRNPQLFLNAQHIVNGMFFSQDPMRDIIRTPGSSGFTGPRKGDDWLYLEYLEHGTLLRFVDMCIELQLHQIPNRLVWRFFLCLIRACVGMAYPPALRMAGASWETIPPNGAPEDHIHGDMHSGNVMITGNQYHELGVMLKLVDFGEWETEQQGDGPPRNIFDAACLIVELVLLIPDGASKIFQAGSSPVRAQSLADPSLLENPVDRPNSEVFESYADFLVCNPMQSPHFQPGGLLENQDKETYLRRLLVLDPDLKNLLIWCLAASEAKRPSLRHILTIATGAMNRTPEHYRDWWERSGRQSLGWPIDASIYQYWGETDDGLRQVLQTTIYNAATRQAAQDDARDQQIVEEDRRTGQSPESYPAQGPPPRTRRQGQTASRVGRLLRRGENTRQFYTA